MADNINYFSDDEESEWLANFDPSLSDKSNEEKQFDDNEISTPIPFRLVYIYLALPLNIREIRPH